MQKLFYHILQGKKYFQRLFLSVALLLLAMQIFATPAFATGVYEMPMSASEHTWILDRGEVLSRNTEGQISGALENLAKQTGNQVRFVTIHRLDYGETTQSFTDKLFTQWFPTAEAQANQSLLVIDTLTNTTGIRTGENVKSLMSDDIAQSVASETVLVPLRQGDKYNQAFSDASDRISAVLSGQPDPGVTVVAENIQVESTFKKAEETDDRSSTIWVIALLIAATVIPMATYYWYQSMGS